MCWSRAMGDGWPSFHRERGSARPARDAQATRAAVRADRASLAHIGGASPPPIGAYARLDVDTLSLAGMVGARDGRVVRGELSGPDRDPAALGVRLAEEILDGGGREL